MTNARQAATREFAHSTPAAARSLLPRRRRGIRRASVRIVPPQRGEEWRPPARAALMRQAERAACERFRARSEPSRGSPRNRETAIAECVPMELLALTGQQQPAGSLAQETKGMFLVRTLPGSP